MIKTIVAELIQASTLPNAFQEHLKKQVEKIPEDLLFQVFDREIDRLDLTVEKLSLKTDFSKIEKELFEINKLHKDLITRYEKAKTLYEEEVENIKKESKEKISQITKNVQTQIDSEKIKEIRSSLKNDSPR
jgi:hypothetical protein